MAKPPVEQAQEMIRRAMMLLAGDLSERVTQADFKVATLSFYTSALSALDSAIRHIDQCVVDASNTD